MNNVAKLTLPKEIDFVRYYRTAEPIAKVLPAGAFRDALGAYMRHVDTGERDQVLPWQSVGDKIQFRAGEVSLWAGANGCGKSYLTGMVMLHFAQLQRVGIASFEMQPVKTLARMVRQASRTSWPSLQNMNRFVDWAEERVWLYDHQGQVRHEQLFGAIKYMAIERGVKQIVIDSLMKCMRAEDDYNAQKVFVGTICQLARDLDVHLHVVHHIRKQQNDDDPPNRYDAKGSGSITDQVDNVFLIWRNKKKERDLERGVFVGSHVEDAMVICDKQRNGEWEGRIKLWVDRASWQFVDNEQKQLIELAAC